MGIPVKDAIAAANRRYKRSLTLRYLIEVGNPFRRIALRCPAVAARPARGAFVELSREGVADVTDPALRHMLERLADESRIGNYGIYFGNHQQGRVQRIAEDSSK